MNDDLFQFDYCLLKLNNILNKNLYDNCKKDISENLKIDLHLLVYKLNLNDLNIENKDSQIRESIINKNLEDYYRRKK
jgi:hypothetical protein